MKVKSNWLVWLLIVFMVSSLVVGCSGEKKEASESAAEKEAQEEAKKEEISKQTINEEFISIGTSSSGGLFNSMGVALSQVWMEKIPGVKFSAQVTGGSGENSINLGQKKLDVALISGATAYEAANGLGKFEGNKVEGLRAITSLYPAVIQIPVLKESGINNLLDIKGKKVNIGQAGSGSEATTLSLLDGFGIKLEEFDAGHLSHSNAADAVVDEKMAGYINIGGVGQGHQMKAMSSGKVKIINLEPVEFREKFLTEYPYYFEFKINEGAYPNQDYPVTTVAASTLLVAREDLSEEIVYQITKTLFENVDTLENTVSVAKDVTLESALNGVKIPLHPGAEKYFKEVGVIE